MLQAIASKIYLRMEIKELGVVVFDKSYLNFFSLDTTMSKASTFFLCYFSFLVICSSKEPLEANKSHAYDPYTYICQDCW